MRVNINLYRRYVLPEYTIGKLYIEDQYLCDTVEDAVRTIKVYGETAIPFGSYRVRVSMSPKFKRLLPLLEDVPEFTGIRIHRGNTAHDSHGCIIPGENKIKGGVINSTQYEDMLTGFIRTHERLGNEVWINILR